MLCAFRHIKLPRHFLVTYWKLKKGSSGWPNGPTCFQMWLLCRLVWWTSICTLNSLFHLTFIHYPASQVSKPHVQQILNFSITEKCFSFFFSLPRHFVHIIWWVSSCSELLMEHCCWREPIYLPCSSCFSCWISAMAGTSRKCNIQWDAPCKNLGLMIYIASTGLENVVCSDLFKVKLLDSW